MRKDETGNKYGRLTVISFAGVSHDGKAMWNCVCDCGKETIVRGKDLRNGRTTSCGCLVIENLTVKKIAKTHGMNDCRLHRIWKNMKTRCYNPNTSYYKYYGAKGIEVCDEWKNDFKAFYDWSISHGYSEDLTIDRINTFGNYEPSNCRWMTIQEQQQNRSHCLKYKENIQL